VIDGSHVMHKPSSTHPVSPAELLDGVPAGVLLIDPARRVLYANSWWSEQLGLPADRLAAGTLYDLLPDTEHARADCALDRLFDTHESTSWETYLEGREGKTIVVFSAQPAGTGRTVTAAQVSCLDVTAQRKALDEAAAYQRDLERLRLQSTALYSIGIGCAVATDVGEVLRLIHAQAAALYSFSSFAILLYDADTGEVSTELHVHDGQLRPPARWPLVEDRDPIAYFLLNAQPLLIGDWLQEASHPLAGDEMLVDPSMRSWLSVPLGSKEHVLGMICLQHTEPSAYSDADQRSLYAIADHAALFIENARLHEAVSKQLAEVSTLYMLAEQLSSSLDTDTVLDLVTNILMRVLNCRGCVIFLLDENREWLEIQVSSGIKPEWRQARLRLGEGVAGRVALTGQPIYISDARCDPGFIVFDPAVRSLLVVPLVHKGQVIGTLNVDDDKPDAFTPDTVRILSIAGAQTAVAIENARLFEELRERAERLARAHRELQESDRLRTEFVQNISHELRTPLTFIKGYVELLLDGTLGQLTPQQRESLQIVAERTARVTQLVDEILTLQQVERSGLHLAPVLLERIAHAEVRSAKAMAEQEGLTLVEDYAPDLKLALGDHERLGQVFANLIGNAIKFTPDGGTITVRLANDRDSVRADVIDEGIGIAQDNLARIFERFYQVDGSSKRRFRGTGLGLAIVKEIIDAHGGTITVSSEIGSGSTFSFTVPVATEEPAGSA
jgi:signal transduction histidine kinase